MHTSNLQFDFDPKRFLLNQCSDLDVFRLRFWNVKTASSTYTAISEPLESGNSFNTVNLDTPTIEIVGFLLPHAATPQF